MADVSENLGNEELQSLIFLLSSILPKERLARATVRKGTLHVIGVSVSDGVYVMCMFISCLFHLISHRAF